MHLELERGWGRRATIPAWRLAAVVVEWPCLAAGETLRARECTNAASQ